MAARDRRPAGPWHHRRAAAERFARDEATALRPLGGRPPFGQVRDLVRKVQSDCAVEVDTNSYSVPWRLIGESVQVTVSGGQVHVHHAGRLVAEHAEATGRRLRIVERSHFAGVVSPGAGSGGPDAAVVRAPLPAPAPELLRCLSEYEAVAGGGW